MAELRIKSVKKPVLLKDLGFGLASRWGGRVYGADDMVPAEDANFFLSLKRERQINK